MCTRIIRRLRQIVMDSREFAAEPRAEIRQRTARINKGYKQRSAFEIGQANRLSILIDEFQIRRATARGKSMDSRRRLWSLSAACVGSADVVQPVIFACVGDDVRRDLVTGLQDPRCP